VLIDKKNGARYIDQDRCSGCGRCDKACPLSPEKKVLFYKMTADGKRTFYKCDLCRERDEGPVCVQMCPRGALEFRER
jgi:Fe-S-cluster-containing hydrogenase component 2